jgi:hypothetical protein
MRCVHLVGLVGLGGFLAKTGVSFGSQHCRLSASVAGPVLRGLHDGARETYNLFTSKTDEHVDKKAVGNTRNVLESPLYQCFHMLAKKPSGFHV